MYTHILIRFGELSTKGKNKMSFVRQLEKNIKKLVGAKEIDVQFDRIFIEYSEENIEGLKRIFGIQSYSPVKKIETSKENIDKTILSMVAIEEGNSFKVRVKRHFKKYPGNSMEIARQLGGLVLASDERFSVKMKNWDFLVEVEIREKFSYVFVKRINGLGGYPVGINGKVLHLISGGIDSPLAALNMMKRGIHVDFLNFITPPKTDQRTIDKVNKIINKVVAYQGKATLFRSNYTKLMLAIMELEDESYRITLMRRSFYRIASSVGLKYSYLGLSNGENLGQVASQTLESIAVIQEASSFPIYRPLLTSDKLETIEKARKLGLYQISIEKAEETCELFAPDKPVIKPRLSKAVELESEIEDLEELENINVNDEIEIKKFIFNLS